MNIRYVSTCQQRARMQIKNLVGDTTLDGTLRTNNIEPTVDDGTVKISSVNIGSLSVGGQLSHLHLAT